MSMLEGYQIIGHTHDTDEHLMWQIADLHLARPQGLWASLRYPVQSDRQLGPADDIGRPRHRLHFEDAEHTTKFTGSCISEGCPVTRVMSRDRSELRAQRADNTSDFRQPLFIDVVMDTASCAVYNCDLRTTAKLSLF